MSKAKRSPVLTRHTLPQNDALSEYLIQQAADSNGSFAQAEERLQDELIAALGGDFEPGPDNCHHLAMRALFARHNSIKVLGNLCRQLNGSEYVNSEGKQVCLDPLCVSMIRNTIDTVDMSDLQSVVIDCFYTAIMSWANDSADEYSFYQHLKGAVTLELKANEWYGKRKFDKVNDRLRKLTG